MLANQLDLIGDLYYANKIKDLYVNMLQNNKIILNKTKEKANFYVVNIHNSSKVQIELFRKFCKYKICKIYITPPGKMQTIIMN